MSEPAQPKGTQSAGPPVAAWLAAAVAAVGYASLRLSLGTEFQGASWEKLYALTAPRPYGHRVLPSLLARPLHGLGLPTDLFTPTFAIARAAGWAGHALEQIAAGRLIRPAAHYTGATGRRWVEIDARTAAA